MAQYDLSVPVPRPFRAIVCSAVFLATADAWVASYFASVGVYRFVDWCPTIVMGNSLWKHEFSGAELTGGAVLVGTAWRWPGPPNMSPAFVYDAGWRFGRTGRPLGSVEPTPNLFRFGRSGTYEQRMTQDWILRVPFWFLSLFAALPFYQFSVRPWRAAQRAARVGRCPRCLYDLRESPDRCPECGTPVRATG